MEKEIVKVRTMNMLGIRIGKPITAIGMDGKVYKTSPVVSYVASGLTGLYQVETEHTVYVV